MHITIFVYGTWGDLRPHTALGMALKERGHDIQVVASRGYEDWIRARNLDYYPLTSDVNVFTKENAAIIDEGIIQQIQMSRKALPPIMTQMGAECYEATRDSDVLMTVEFGVSLLFDVIKTNNLKTILINPAHLNLTSEFSSAATPAAPDWFPFPKWYNRMSYSLVQRIQWMVFSGSRNKIAEKLGVDKSKFAEFQAMINSTPALTTVSKHILQRPADWGEHWQITGYIFDEDADWSPPQDLVDFLEAGEAPVYIGFGSMPDSKPEATTRTIIEAVQKTGKRAIILSGWAELGADDVPDNIYILKYAPHNWLFPKMSALIHHGGAGTTASGLRAGVPTTIVPHAGDQAYWGRTVKQLGIGTDPIPRKKLSVENLAQVIRTLTSDKSLRDNAQALSQKIQEEDGLAEAVQWVERFLSS